MAWNCGAANLQSRSQPAHLRLAHRRPRHCAAVGPQAGRGTGLPLRHAGHALRHADQDSINTFITCILLSRLLRPGGSSCSSTSCLTCALQLAHARQSRAARAVQCGADIVAHEATGGCAVRYTPQDVRTPHMHYANGVTPLPAVARQAVASTGAWCAQAQAHTQALDLLQLCTAPAHA